MPQKIVVINRKGGCGKTTLTTNLAGFYASQGEIPALLDYDPQDSAMRWIRMRPPELAPIHGVGAAHHPKAGTTRSFQLRIPPETRHIVIDTPASLKKMELIDVLRGATALLIPVLPSSIDLHVTGDFIEDLRSMLRIYAPSAAIAIVANRVRFKTRSYDYLKSYFDDLGLPPVTCLRDTQNYVRTSHSGMCIHELHGHRTRTDREEWAPLVEWLDSPPDPSRSQPPARYRVTGSG